MAAPDSHRLENKWTLYFDCPQKGRTSYGATYRAVHTFDTVEEFWRLYSTVKKPSALPPQSTYFLFKGDIKPEWEDPVNEKGGCWSINLMEGEQMDDTWLNTVLAVIGEQFKNGEDINGLSVNIRKKNRLEIWTRHANQEAKQKDIGEDFKRLSEQPGLIGGYASFDAKKSNKPSNLYTL
mmetsp:Transcript_9164/g.17218  ORF Transcript_9164/g.17218 Transcript_9164/m.17218 type:complete len:180 (-) Transcript_9164:125-664(-)|eukprot:CAMPEP_0175045640 /NCGR_PEP_ID=MMETSP0052_2-20121109/4549_1 /TAXON_ID=51329 ORGANISM="Polytomella parva, Strain SAG 63-3" /NCGR_SAMPLE_ID=MMETSP0052_2 /ASSEMBLY_ACC=CAM_ASM_000194 /LENGTH=179 /DNA_ID=CAMNT_0016309221 /DNA_START=34 /DNA_END=573 /DNA_ORIENTATION=-